MGCLWWSEVLVGRLMMKYATSLIRHWQGSKWQIMHCTMAYWMVETAELHLAVTNKPHFLLVRVCKNLLFKGTVLMERRYWCSHVLSDPWQRRGRIEHWIILKTSLIKTPVIVCTALWFGSWETVKGKVHCLYDLVSSRAAPRNGKGPDFKLRCVSWAFFIPTYVGVEASCSSWASWQKEEGPCPEEIQSSREVRKFSRWAL